MVDMFGEVLKLREVFTKELELYKLGKCSPDIYWQGATFLLAESEHVRNLPSLLIQTFVCNGLALAWLSLAI